MKQVYIDALKKLDDIIALERQMPLDDIGYKLVEAFYGDYIDTPYLRDKIFDSIAWSGLKMEKASLKGTEWEEFAEYEWEDVKTVLRKELKDKIKSIE